MDKLCLGGSFNPIHYGHLRCSQAVARHRGFTGVVLIPASVPRLKPASYDLAPPEHRLAMCKLAAEENPFFEVDDLELHRPGESYTIDTVRALKARGWGRVSWLIGADQLPALPRWREAEKLIEEADLLVMARPGWSFDFDSLPEPFRRLRSAVVAAPSIDISATDIRRRVRAHEPIDHLTPPAVARYIETHGLYR